MNKFLPDDYAESAIEIAQSILDRTISYVEGCRKLARMRAHAFNTTFVFDPFVGIDSETDGYPVGEVRKHWNAQFLAEEDARIQNYESLIRETLDKNCRDLIIKLRDSIRSNTIEPSATKDMYKILPDEYATRAIEIAWNIWNREISPIEGCRLLAEIRLHAFDVNTPVFSAFESCAAEADASASGEARIGDAKVSADDKLYERLKLACEVLIHTLENSIILPAK